MKNGLLIASACLLGLLSTIGASLAYPLLPPLFTGASNALNSSMGMPPKLLFGIALMVNPVGLLLGSAVLGPISDGLGRRRILLLTALGAAAGHLLTAYALLIQSYPLLVAARFFTGLLEGNGAILRALLAERLAGPLRNHALSWLNGAFNLGWLAGPLLSGFSASHSITLPFYIAAGGLLLGAVLSTFVLKPEPPHAAAQAWWQVARRRHAFTLLRHAPLQTLFLVHFAYACGVAGFYEFFPLWLVEVGGYDAAGIALGGGLKDFGEAREQSCHPRRIGHRIEAIAAGPAGRRAGPPIQTLQGVSVDRADRKRQPVRQVRRDRFVAAKPAA